MKSASGLPTDAMPYLSYLNDPLFCRVVLRSDAAARINETCLQYSLFDKRSEEAILNPHLFCLLLDHSRNHFVGLPGLLLGMSVCKSCEWLELRHCTLVALIANPNAGSIVASGSWRFQVKERWPRARAYPDLLERPQTAS